MSGLSLAGFGGDDGDVFLDGDVLSMTSVFQRGAFWVRLVARPEVYIIESSNATAGVARSNLGRVVNVRLFGPAGKVIVLSGNETDVLASAVEIAIHVVPSDMSVISLATPFALAVQYVTRLSGRCIPANYSAPLGLAVTLAAPKNASLASVVASRTAVSSAAVSSVLSNPMSALTTMSMVSLLQISSCMFSDVDPLEPEMSPLQVSLGPEEGQYYRGAVVVALAVHLIPPLVAVAVALVLLRTGAVDGGISGAFYHLRFPSVMLIVLPIFFQGMVTSAVSLIRMNCASSENSTASTATLDILLAAAALVCAAGVIAFALRSTNRPLFQCRLEAAQEGKGEEEGNGEDGDASSPAEPLDDAAHSRVLRVLLSFAVWRMHWVDTSATGLFKRQYLLLMDDMALPWWSAVELASCALQGAVLGLRLNDETVCLAQQIALLAHCAMMLTGVLYLRPRGSHLAQLFLIAAKVGSLLVSLFILVYTLTGNDTFVDVSDDVAAVFSAVSSLEPVSFVLLLVLNKWSIIKRFVHKLQKHIGRSFDSGEPVMDGLACPIQQGNTDDERPQPQEEEAMDLHYSEVMATVENQANRTAFLAQLANAELRAALTDDYIAQACMMHHHHHSAGSVGTTLAYLVERASLVAALHPLRKTHLKSIPPQDSSDQ